MAKKNTRGKTTITRDDILTVNGESHTLYEWSKIKDISLLQIMNRVRSNMTPEDIISPFDLRIKKRSAGIRNFKEPVTMDDQYKEIDSFLSKILCTSTKSDFIGISAILACVNYIAKNPPNGNNIREYLPNFSSEYEACNRILQYVKWEGPYRESWHDNRLYGYKFNKVGAEILEKSPVSMKDSDVVSKSEEYRQNRRVYSDAAKKSASSDPASDTTLASEEVSQEVKDFIANANDLLPEDIELFVRWFSDNCIPYENQVLSFAKMRMEFKWDKRAKDFSTHPAFPMEYFNRVIGKALKNLFGRDNALSKLTIIKDALYLKGYIIKKDLMKMNAQASGDAQTTTNHRDEEEQTETLKKPTEEEIEELRKEPKKMQEKIDEDFKKKTSVKYGRPIDQILSPPIKKGSEAKVKVAETSEVKYETKVSEEETYLVIRGKKYTMEDIENLKYLKTLLSGIF